MKIRIVSIVALLFAAPLYTRGQNFQALRDIDSTLDWAYNIFIQTDSNYFIIGASSTAPTVQWQLMNAVISKDGNSVLNHHLVKLDTASIYIGNAGEAERLPDGGYVCPITVQRPRGNYLSSQAGLVKFDQWGDTVFLKTYTDTSVYFDNIYALAVMPDAGFLLGGGHGLNTPSHFPGYLIRTDSNGNLMWTHTYHKIFSQDVRIKSLQILSDGRILVGASSSYQKNLPQSFTYFHSSPWFLILDTLGNIIRDTLYDNQYHGSTIQKDANGGYFHWGALDTLITSDPYDAENFPSYFAHLDTNFNITWRIVFHYSLFYGQREPWSVRQLQDGNYLITGAIVRAVEGNPISWAAKISSAGTLLWNHIFISDTTEDGYFTTATERPDGSLILVGMTSNDTLPSWHTNEDIWLVSLDSNGCLVSGCSPDTVDPTAPTDVTVLQQEEMSSLSLYPNPTTGSFTIHTSDSGEFDIYCMEGRLVTRLQLKIGNNQIAMPAAASSGIYMGVFKANEVSKSGSKQQVVRIVYEP